MFGSTVVNVLLPYKEIATDHAKLAFFFFFKLFIKIAKFIIMYDQL